MKSGYTADEIARVVDGRPVGAASGEGAFCGPSASIDTRTLERGEIFFALRGERTDGHRHLEEAFRKGASLAVVARSEVEKIRAALDAGRAVAVDDPSAALIELASHHRGRFAPRTVGVTGSNGKTATKEMIAAVLRRAGETLASPGNFNNLLGIPLTLLDLRESHRWLVLEMGISLPGEMARLAALARPDAAVVTNVHAAHVEGLGDEAAIAREKLDIVKGLAEEGVLHVNGDDAPLLEAARSRWGNVRTFGLGPENDVGPASCEPWRREGIRFAVDGEGTIAAPLHGRHQVRNALGAVAACLGFGIPFDTIREGLAGVRLPEGRFAVEEAGGVLIVDDTYNANTASVVAAVEFLANVECRGARVLVLGDMLELGPAERRCHWEAGTAVAAHDLDRLFLWGERSAHVADGAVEAGYPHERITLAMEGKERFAGEVVRSLKPGDVVVIKGSRGMKMEVIRDAIRERLAGSGAAKGGM